MKKENPIEEIWRIREEIAEENGYDLQKHFSLLRHLEKKHPHRFGTPSSKNPILEAIGTKGSA